MNFFRHGQWVKFSAVGFDDQLEAAHRAKDGKVVGIFQREHTDSFGDKINICVIPVNEAGTNLPFFDGEKVHTVMIVSSALSSIEPLLDMADLPPGRQIHPDFKLRP
jgi:hypothetical protein